MKTATSRELSAAESAPWSTSQVLAGVCTTELGSVDGAFRFAVAARALRVALATAWIAGERDPGFEVRSRKLGEQRLG